MNKYEKLEMYGVTESRQILGSIERACDIFGNGKHYTAKVMLEKTIRHESHLGTFPDKSKNYGEGVSQFDKLTFEWVKEKVLTDKDYIMDLHKMKKYYNLNLSDVQYDRLRYDINLQIILTRMKYKFVPDIFPIDDYEQFLYYKKHWNSSDGAATYKKWVQDTGNCFFKAGD